MIVGIDVSKDKLDIYSLPEKRHYLIKNSTASINSFIKNKLLPGGVPELVVFEATGGYEKLLQLSLLDTGLPYHKAHATRVHHFGKSKGYFAKTDKIDACLLAKYGQQEEITSDKIGSEEQLIRQELVSRRAQVQLLLEKERPKLKGTYINKTVRRSIKRLIAYYEKELTLIDKEIEALITADKELSEKRELLQSMKGIGKKIATVLVTLLPELGRISREKISNLVGVAPKTKDSGQKKGHRSISHGRSYVRKLLYMGALVAARRNPCMKKIYDRLLAKGKKKKVALVAVMRKMLIILNAMVKNNTPWASKEFSLT